MPFQLLIPNIHLKVQQCVQKNAVNIFPLTLAWISGVSIYTGQEALGSNPGSASQWLHDLGK